MNPKCVLCSDCGPRPWLWICWGFPALEDDTPLALRMQKEIAASGWRKSQPSCDKRVRNMLYRKVAYCTVGRQAGGRVVGPDRKNRFVMVTIIPAFRSKSSVEHKRIQVNQPKRSHVRIHFLFDPNLTLIRVLDHRSPRVAPFMKVFYGHAASRKD